MEHPWRVAVRDWREVALAIAAGVGVGRAADLGKLVGGMAKPVVLTARLAVDADFWQVAQQAKAGVQTESEIHCL